MQSPNVNLTKQDYQNLVNILESVDIKGRKSAEYIAILGMKLDARIRNWFDKHPTGFDIIETAKTSEAFEAEVSARAKELANKAIADRDAEILNKPLLAGYQQDT